MLVVDCFRWVVYVV